MTELVLSAMRGDKKAFTELIESSRQTMYKVARSYFSEPMDADDCISEAICLCWENIGKLKKPEYFKTWLCRILINTCNKTLSQRRSYVPLDELSENSQPASYQRQPEDGFERLMELTDSRYRTVLVLYYSEGFSISEISNLTGMPQGTVSSHLMRGRQQLAKRLKEEDIL